MAPHRINSLKAFRPSQVMADFERVRRESEIKEEKIQYYAELVSRGLCLFEDGRPVDPDWQDDDDPPLLMPYDENSPLENSTSKPVAPPKDVQIAEQTAESLAADQPCRDLA